MAVSTIDGTIESVEPGKQYPKVTRFKTIVFREDGGGSRTIKNALASGDVAPEIRQGNRARFYTFTALDVRGIYGVRKPDGSAAYAYPASANSKVFLILIAVNIAWIALKVAVDGELPFLGVILMLFGAFGWFMTSKGGKEARAQFDSDAARSDAP